MSPNSICQNHTLPATPSSDFLNDNRPSWTPLSPITIIHSITDLPITALPSFFVYLTFLFCNSGYLGRNW